MKIELNLPTPSKFTKEIELIVVENNLSHLDAVLHYCQHNKLDYDLVKRLLTKPLKEKIGACGKELNLMKVI